MNKIKIPTQFELCGRTIKVINKDDLVDEYDAVGLAKYRKNEICLQNNISGVKRTVDHKNEAFYHELTHWILHAISENRLRDNEKFVSLFSEHLHQAFKTAVYK